MNFCKEGSSLEHCRCLDGKLQIKLFKCVQETTQPLESLLNNSSANYGNQSDDIFIGTVVSDSSLCALEDLM